MDLRSLKYFVHAVEAGTISAAAEQCHISQPSITNAIAQLENEFETTFLIRSRKGVTTTEAGERFYQKSKALLQHAALIKSDMQNKPKDTVELYVAPSVNAHALIFSMEKLQALHPDVSWVLTSNYSSATHQLINMQQLKDNQEWTELLKEEYYLLLPSHHDFAKAHSLNTKLTLHDLLTLSWIERSHCEFAPEFNRLITTQTASVQLVARVDNEDWAVALVAAGLGATIMPFSPNQLPESIYAIPLTDIEGAPSLSRTLGLANDY
ncbi:LysR family transcriptional regulator [Litoribacillus peritrichatus]|uniref:LysR family transcriptional regulator n=1 Tax=Litoribacillus peritrichatus TaxID=718191 RepID=A0ABP7M8J9_9GAMM